jgi:PAS domain S-box-containing protein
LENFMPDNERAGETSIKRDLGGLEKRGGGFVEAVEAMRMPMLITDAQESGFPIIYANPAFLGMLGLKQGEAIGRDYASVVVQHVDPETLKTTTERMASHIASTHEFLLRKQDGSTVWVSQSIDPVTTEGRIVRHLASFYDITERVLREQQLRGEKGALERRFNARAQQLQQTTERLEEEIERRMRLEATLRDTLIERDKDLRLRDFLISEIEHRTANAFQLTAGILSTQGLHSSSVETRDALELATERIIRIGEMHAHLTFRASEPGLVDFSVYLHRLCKQMVASLTAEPDRVRVDVEIEEEANWRPNVVIPLGLVAGEALTNAFKHAFPNDRAGRVRMVLQSASGGRMCLRIEDNGIGMSAEQRKGSLGLHLINMAARQIEGVATVEARTKGTGTVVTVDFPDPDNSGVLHPPADAARLD